MIVDDIKMNRSMLKRRFQKSIAPNCVIVEATTGEEALKICENERFDVILVDQHMEEVRLLRLYCFVLHSASLFLTTY
jgi:CheY-like chemotaxis protein